MKWHLDVKIEQKNTFRKIKHEDVLLSIGSCFSEHMGAKLEERGLQIVNNPFGILYNPFSIQKALEKVVSGQLYTEDELMHHNGRWLSLDHHGSFSDQDKQNALEKINRSLEEAAICLKSASTILVTFGTAYYYSWKEDGRIIGNNHKISSDHFIRHRANISDIVSDFSALIEKTKNINKDLQWVFTVSPVRHWKNGAADDHWSKSILTCAIRELVETSDYLHYFPSFEILMDELRGYRFYEADLVHPNAQAVEYIWNAFSEACVSQEARKVGDEVLKVRQRMAHRVFNAADPKTIHFQTETQSMAALLIKKYPYLSI